MELDEIDTYSDQILIIGIIIFIVINNFIQ
jgi:hypothetical protein